MPKITFGQTNFTAGELSPKLRGRTDISRYANGAEEVRDLVPQVFGGVKRRPGSLFVHETKDSSKRSRLVPFVKDADAAYVLEFGDLYMRVYKNGALIELSPGVPYELSSPYTAAQVQEFDYTQGADTMFLFHQAVSPYKLVCAGDTSWTLSAAAFVEVPYEEPGSFPPVTLTATDAGPVGAASWVAAGEYSGTPGANSAIAWSAGVVTVTRVGHGLATGNAVSISGTVPTEYSKTAVITVVDADKFTYPLAANPGAATSSGFTLALSGAGTFTAADVGSSVKINSGVIKLTGFISASVMAGVVKQELASVIGARESAWSLNAPAWSASRGYPRSGTLFEQRLICAGSPGFPQTIWGSVTGAYLDFTQGTNDDDAFNFTIASDIANPIRYVATGRTLVALTSGAEFTVEGGVEKPLTPTSARIKLRKNYGCALVRPVRVGESELFVQRAGKRVRSFGYSLANDEWTGPDLSVLADHLADKGIVDMCWQQEPMPIVWLAGAGGELMSMTLDRDQDVVAWAWHEKFVGAVESFASIPGSDSDQVWMVVRYTVGGVTKRYVERLSEATKMDSAIVASGAAATVWGGLSHLEGETVHVVADGAYRGTFPVSGGQITLARAASQVNIGRNYIPRLVLLPPEVQGAMGSATGNAMRTSEVTLRFHETTGCTVNGNRVIERKTGDAVLDAAPVLFTGVQRAENLGFDRGESPIVIEQLEPMPMHLLSVTRKFTFNEG